MVLDDALVDVAMGLMSCAPAYVALVAEAQVDAGVRRGIPAAQGAELVVQTLAGTAELLRRRGYDTLAVRREVASPGGHRPRAGLDALERGGLRAAFSDALDAVLRPVTRDGPRQRAAPQIADFLSALIYVYTLLIIVYIVIQLLFAVGPAPAVLARDRRRAAASCATSASRSCASSAACCRRSAASTSARCWRSSRSRSSTASSSSGMIHG